MEPQFSVKLEPPFGVEDCLDVKKEPEYELLPTNPHTQQKSSEVGSQGSPNRKKEGPVPITFKVIKVETEHADQEGERNEEEEEEDVVEEEEEEEEEEENLQDQVQVKDEITIEDHEIGIEDSIEEQCRYEPQLVFRTEYSGRISAHFWGYMTAAGAGDLIPVPGRMNSAAYFGILENTLLPCLWVDLPEQDEFSAVRSSYQTRAWLAEHFQPILVEWLPLSLRAPVGLYGEGIEAVMIGLGGKQSAGPCDGAVAFFP